MRIKKKTLFLNILLCMLLFLISLWGVNKGLNFTDAGYSLSNFENFGIKVNDWTFATFLSNALGAFFMHLPFGNTMLGMNIYTALLSGGVSVLSFLWLSKTYSAIGVFVGECIALFFCWLPNVVLYNYLSFGVLTLAVILLYQGLINKKNILLLFSGILLGINVFVRFPNIIQCILILAVLFFLLISKEKLKKSLISLGYCFGGYIIGFAAIYFVVLIGWGKKVYWEMIEGLGRSAESNVSYSPVVMVQNILNEFWNEWKWMLVLIVFCIFLIGVLAVLQLFKKRKVLNILFYGFEFILFLMIIRVYHYYGVFTMKDYTNYASIRFFVTFILSISAIIALVNLLKKDGAKEDRLRGAIMMLLLIIVPLGSNTGILSYFNFMILFTPYTICELVRGYCFIGKRYENKKQWLYFRPILDISFLLIALGMIQGAIFQYTFTYGDVGVLAGTNTPIIRNERLKGMETLEGMVPIVEELTEYIDSNGLKGTPVITYGNIPLMSYALEMPTAISTAWPDLDSYSYDDFVDEMNTVNTPVIIVNRWFCEDIFNEEIYEILPKAKTLAEFAKQNDYKEVYRNDKFIVYYIDIE